jgi:hypothetical protein
MAPSTKQTIVGIRPDRLLKCASERRGWRRDVTSTIRNGIEWGSGAHGGSLQGRIRAPYPHTNDL